MENMTNNKHPIMQQQNTSKNIMFGYRWKIPTIYNTLNQEYMKYAWWKWQRMSEKDYEDYSEKLSEEEFISQFGKEVIDSYDVHLRTIEQNIIEVINWSSDDWDTLKSNILRWLL
jgi:hypothetical protein